MIEDYFHGLEGEKEGWNLPNKIGPLVRTLKEKRLLKSISAGDRTIVYLCEKPFVAVSEMHRKGNFVGVVHCHIYGQSEEIDKFLALGGLKRKERG